MNPKVICRYNKFGFCKYNTKCRFRHNDLLCEAKSCNVSECEKRHPRICKFKRDYGRCKFTPCAYSHDKPKDVTENSEKIERIENKLKDIEKKQDRPKDQDIGKNIELKLHAMEKEFENKVKAFENKVIELSNEVKEKDVAIKNLEVQIKNLETNHFELLIENRLESESLQDKVENLVEKEIFNCALCAFTTTSKSGLKIHTKRKHTNYSEDVFPRSCELCEKVIQNNTGMKQHLKEHSCQLIQYKCSFCNYLAKDGLAIEAHVRITHEGSFDCCICDFVAKDNESLEIHLNTCETYKCTKCDMVLKTIPEIKHHVEDLHKQENYGSVLHMKRNRENSEAFDSKWYSYKDLFEQN